MPNIGAAHAAGSSHLLPEGLDWQVVAQDETFWITPELIRSRQDVRKGNTYPWQRLSIADAPGLKGRKALRSHVDRAGVSRVDVNHLSPLVPINPARFPAAFMLEVDHWIEKDTGSPIGGKEWALHLGRGYIGDTFFKSDRATYGKDGTVLNVMRPRFPGTGNGNRYGCFATDRSGAAESAVAKRYFDNEGFNLNDDSHYFGTEYKVFKGASERPTREWLKVQAYIIPSPQAGESTFTVRYIRANGEIVVATRPNRVNPFFYGAQSCKVFFAQLRDMDGGNPEEAPSRWAGGSYMRNVRLLTAYRS